MVPDSTPAGNDEQLVRRIAAGDPEAFGLLFRRRQGHVYRFALHMTSSPSIAEDVTQETFLAVMRGAARYDASRATVSAWLCGIARNQVRRRLERDRPLQPFGDVEDDAPLDAQLVATDEDPLGHLAKAEQVTAIRAAVLRLPLRYREAVVLCDLQEMSYVEAARVLECALGTVRSRLHRGRALLAEKLLRESSTEGAGADATPSRIADSMESKPTMQFRRLRNLA